MNGAAPHREQDDAAQDAAAFDRAFHRRSASLAVRPEHASDRDFLRRLFARCSPLAATLPAPLIMQQADLQDIGHRTQHPEAMRRIACRGDAPIGRIVIDWQSTDHSHGVDIAVLPEWRASGAGLQLLRAWLEVADRHGRASRLHVRHDNPAIRLYRRLGFVPLGDAAYDAPIVTMIRPCAGACSRSAKDSV